MRWTRDHGIIRGEQGEQIALVAWDIEANARLIAAAPKLLEALEELRSEAVGYIGAADEAGDTEAVAAMEHLEHLARTAITEAKGE